MRIIESADEKTTWLSRSTFCRRIYDGRAARSESATIATESAADDIVSIPTERVSGSAGIGSGTNPAESVCGKPVATSSESIGASGNESADAEVVPEDGTRREASRPSREKIFPVIRNATNISSIYK